MSWPEVVEAAQDVFLCRGRDVNWVLLREGSDLTLIDTGYPGYVEAVEASIRELGHRPEDVRAILVTHAHVDHVGGLGHFHRSYGPPVFFDPAEVRHARRERLEQATAADVARNLHHRGVLPWTLRIIRAGALQDVAFREAQPFPTDGPLDLPGRPVPVPTSGHTSGHSAYFVPQAGAVATGDALATGHAVSTYDGPQLLPLLFQHGDDLAGLARLAALDGDVVLPGHGPVHHGSIAGAVDHARASADRRRW